MQLLTENATWATDEHLMFADMVSRFYDDELVPNIEQWAEQGKVDREFWVKAGNVGILGAAIPEEYEGSGGDIGFDAITIYEQSRHSDIGWGFGIHSIVTHYLFAFGSADQKARWLPRMARGEIVPAIAMTEPACGSDLQGVAMTADKDGDDYLINGTKTFITNGGSADLVILVVKTDRQVGGAKGISLIAVETKDLEGFSLGKPLKKLGMKGNDTSELIFENVRVPQTNLLGDVGAQGFYQLMKQLPWERLTIGISALGSIDFALDETLRYVSERKAFGKRVLDFQNTRFKLAECTTKAEVLRAFINECITSALRGKLTPEKASMAKYFGSETQVQVMHECLQLFGGYGYMMEYPIARLYADARVQMIYGGTNEIMKELIARDLDI